MIKDLPSEPLEFSFDEEEQDVVDDGTKTYALPVKQAESHQKEDEDLTLGAVVESEELSSSFSELRLEDDDEELTIAGLPNGSTTTVLTIADTETAEELVEETKALIEEIKETAQHSETPPDVVPQTQEVVATQVISTTESPQKTPSPKKAQKLSTKKLTNIILGVSFLFLVAIVVAVNVLLFVDVSNDRDMSDLTQAINQTSGDPNQMETRRSKEADKNSPQSASTIQIGQLSSTSIQGEYRFVFDRSKESGSLQIDATTPAPAPLSIEEIGRQQKALPWLKKVETQKFPFKNLTSESSIKISIPTRFYFEQSANSTRFVGNTNITITRDHDNAITIDYRFEIPTTAKISLPEESISGKITFSF